MVRGARVGPQRSVFVERFDNTLASDRQRPATTIQSLTDRCANPTLGDAVLLDIGVFDTIEANPDATRENRLVVITARRVHAEAVGESRCVD